MQASDKLQLSTVGQGVLRHKPSHVPSGWGGCRGLLRFVSKVSLYIAAISVGAASISQVRDVNGFFCGDEVDWPQPCKQVAYFNS
jgi:hypothetical protein